MNESKQLAYAKWSKKRYRCKPEDTIWRNTAVREMFAQGVKKTSIMRRLHISRESIDTILESFYKLA